MQTWQPAGPYTVYLCSRQIFSIVKFQADGIVRWQTHRIDNHHCTTQYLQCLLHCSLSYTDICIDVLLHDSTQQNEINFINCWQCGSVTYNLKWLVDVESFRRESRKMKKCFLKVSQRRMFGDCRCKIFLQAGWPSCPSNQQCQHTEGIITDIYYWY